MMDFHHSEKLPPGYPKQSTSLHLGPVEYYPKEALHCTHIAIAKRFLQKKTRP